MGAAKASKAVDSANEELACKEIHINKSGDKAFFLFAFEDAQALNAWVALPVSMIQVMGHRQGEKYVQKLLYAGFSGWQLPFPAPKTEMFINENVRRLPGVKEQLKDLPLLTHVPKANFFTWLSNRNGTWITRRRYKFAVWPVRCFRGEELRALLLANQKQK